MFLQITLGDIIWLLKEKVKKVFKSKEVKITETTSNENSCTGALNFQGIWPDDKIYVGGKIKCKK